MTGRFDPFQLTGEASLNRTRIAALTGADMHYVGRPAFELVSMDALTRLALDLRLDVAESRGNIARVISAALMAGDQRAADVVATFGRRLAHLMATLTTTHRIESDESEWRAAYLRYWSQVAQVWLAGGLAAAFGSPLIAAVRAEARRLGADAPIELAPHPEVLALIGAARSRLHPRTHVAVFDFGHTLVKRGIATVRNRQLIRLDVLPSRYVPGLGLLERGTDEEVVEFLLDVVTETIDTSRRLSGAVDPCVMVSLASYLSHGWPVDSHSAYGPLSTRARRSLDTELTRRCGAPVRLRFLHDGTAAARGVRQAGRDGLIVLGTALGVGFPPPASTLLPVSADIVVTPTMLL